jgi:flavin reductase (DIM6/NTAB) family NADH-FMN oxidoreductase RutF
MSSKALPSPVGTVDRNQFCRACGRFATGITIVTSLGPEGEPHGMTANSFTSVSLAPPLVLVCVDHGCKVLGHFRRGEYFGINVLKEGQQELSAHFARGGHDRFNGVKWHGGETGVPLLPDALAAMECALTKTVDAGDHTILIGEVLHVKIREGRPLVYFSSTYRKLDAEP